MRKIHLALLGILLAAVPAGAAPNWWGMSGLMSIPTSEVLAPLELSTSYHYVADTSSVTALNLGLLPNLEVGAIYYKPELAPRTEKYGVSARYRFLQPKSDLGWSGTAGWWDATDTVNSTPYGVLSKQITTVTGFPLRLHLGGGGGIYKDFFVGADLPMAEGLTAMVECDGTFVNAGVRWNLFRGFNADFGHVFGQFAAGASYGVRF